MINDIALVLTERLDAQNEPKGDERASSWRGHLNPKEF